MLGLALSHVEKAHCMPHTFLFVVGCVLDFSGSDAVEEDVFSRWCYLQHYNNPNLVVVDRRGFAIL